MSSKCSEKPIFVVIEETSSGYSFDNDVSYSSPFASHTISQRSDMAHPSIMVESNWGMDKSKAITQLVTGNAGFKILESRSNNNFHRSYPTGESVGLLFNTTHGYRLGRFKPLSGEAPSVAELANLLSNISRSKKDVKVRGSPLEYKRLLDYFQFLLVSKVTGKDSLYLVRPNNVNILDAINERNVSLEEAYMSLFDGELSNRTMYNTAYFVTGDRPAAIASVIRQVPTLFQENTGQKLHLIPKGDTSRIRTYLIKRLTSDKGYTVSAGTGMLSLGEEKIIYQKDNISWYIDSEKLFSVVRSNDVRALILFYWIFSYPGRTNIPLVEAFFAIVDTFHDFKPSKRSSGKGGNGNLGSLFGTQNNQELFKTRKVNTINLNNVSNTTIAHKTLVRLLGTDIYRKVSSGYSNSLKTILGGVNGRSEISPDLKVGRFLYFVTSLFGSDSGSLIGACEDLSRDILLAIASKNSPLYNRGRDSNAPTNPLCQRLDSENACLIIDMVSGSLPYCLAKYSVFHNVGVLDPASKRILSWAEIPNGAGCIETPADIARRKRKQKEARLRARKLKNTRMQAEAKKRRNEMRERTRREAAAKAAANAAANAADKAAKTKTQTLDREARAAGREAAAREAAQKRKRNNNAPSNNQLTKKTKTQTPTIKRERNNNTLNNRPVKKVKSTPTPVIASRPPRPPRSIIEMLSPIPETASARRETRSASAARSRRNAPASAGTRSGVRIPGRTPGRIPGRTPGRIPGRTPGSAQGRTPRTIR